MDSEDKWSNTDILIFIECYKSEPCIWNPKHVNHKDKKEVAEAWTRLSNILYKPVRRLKRKKEILMVTFRRYLKKKMLSKDDGEIFEPPWFAYELMESFLLPIYKNTYNIKIEASTTSPARISKKIDAASETDTEDSKDETGISLSPRIKKRRRCPDSNRVIEKQTNLPGPAPKKDDDCALYAKLLAKKLRELPKDERILLMYEIDGIFIKRITQKSLAETQSPKHSQNVYTLSVNKNEVILPEDEDFEYETIEEILDESDE